MAANGKVGRHTFHRGDVLVGLHFGRRFQHAARTHIEYSMASENRFNVNSTGNGQTGNGQSCTHQRRDRKHFQEINIAAASVGERVVSWREEANTNSCCFKIGFFSAAVGLHRCAGAGAASSGLAPGRTIGRFTTGNRRCRFSGRHAARRRSRFSTAVACIAVARAVRGQSSTRCDGARCHFGFAQCCAHIENRWGRASQCRRSVLAKRCATAKRNWSEPVFASGSRRSKIRAARPARGRARHAGRQPDFARNRFADDRTHRFAARGAA